MADGLPLRTHVIYRGCTRPATFMGVPVMPFVLSAVTLAVPGFWALIFNSLGLAVMFWATWSPIYLGMRFVCRRDPWALHHYYFRWFRRRKHANRDKWGAITYSPFRFDK